MSPSSPVTLAVCLTFLDRIAQGQLHLHSVQGLEEQSEETTTIILARASACRDFAIPTSPVIGRRATESIFRVDMPIWALLLTMTRAYPTSIHVAYAECI